MAASWKLGTSRADVFAGMFLSNLVMFAIITVTAATIGAHGGKDIASAAQAAAALKPVAGSFAQEIFAFGFIGSGMLAVPVLAGSASSGLSGLLGKRSGYSRSPRQAPLFYTLVLAGTLGGTTLSLTHLDPIHLLVLVALVNGAAAAPFLILVMLIARRRDLMGKYRNGPLANTLGWAAVALMGAAAIALIVTGGGG
jgi:Mn2+/Fe2+ NRAMP family transporter